MILMPGCRRERRQCQICAGCAPQFAPGASDAPRGRPRAGGALPVRRRQPAVFLGAGCDTAQAQWRLHIEQDAHRRSPPLQGHCVGAAAGGAGADGRGSGDGAEVRSNSAARHPGLFHCQVRQSGDAQWIRTANRGSANVGSISNRSPTAWLAAFKPLLSDITMTGIGHR